MKFKLSFILIFFSFFACQQDPSPNTLFLKINAEQSGITFSNNLKETEDFNIIEYLYFYNGGGVAVGDINQDGLTDVFLTANQGTNELYLNKGVKDGSIVFENITEKAGVKGKGSWSTGVTMVDVNADGLLDIYVNNVSDFKKLKGVNELYINKGDLNFIESAKEYGLDINGFCTQTAFFDADADGDLDAYVLRHSVHDASNYGDTTLRKKIDPLAGDLFLKNENGVFKDDTNNSGIYSSRLGYGLGIAIGDVNNDSCPDIYVGNDFHENDYLYYGNCDGTFDEGITESMGHTNQFSMGNDLADINNDGLLDLMALDMKPEEEEILKRSALTDPYDIFEFKTGFGYHFQYARNAIQLNQGVLEDEKATFSEVGQLLEMAATDWSWSALWADFNLDGQKDLFVSNGILRRPIDLDYLKFISNPSSAAALSDLDLLQKMPSGAAKNYAYKNTSADNELRFENKSSEWGLDELGFSNGAAYADFDNDGDLDLIVNNLNETASLFINQQNEKTNSNYLKISLKGQKENPFGIGTRVTVFQNGKKQIQELQLSRGFQSSVEPKFHFGFENNKTIDSLQIIWPDRKKKSYFELTLNQEINFNYADAVKEQDKNTKAKSLFFTKSTLPNLKFKHKENRFFDSNRESLIPHLLSTQGPAFAQADVNGDGLDDLFFGGAAGQSAALYFQTKTGFVKSISSPWEEIKSREDVEALFFDANGDGYQDLMVLGGGNEAYTDSPVLADRLYLNNGNGTFEIAINSLPKYVSNGGAIASGDFDLDGDEDLFIGNRSVPYNYGLSPKSYLLENDGKGNFSFVKNELAKELLTIGMVTDARWLNLDEDKHLELVIVGEWMPLTIFDYEGEKWSRKNIPNSEGWWNCIEAEDMDGDGDLDLIAGNLGLNSNLKASQKEPVSLYVNDFDNNQSNDPILTYYRDHKEYVLAGKDLLIKQLAPFRKKYPQYETYAQHTFTEVFSPKMLEKSKVLKVHTFQTTLFENQGNLNFKNLPLPQQAQYAPVHDILAMDVNSDGQKDLILGGNFYEVQPYIGRYDASCGSLLLNNGNGEFIGVSPGESGLNLSGAVRHLSIINQDETPTLISIINNGQPSFFNKK